MPLCVPTHLRRFHGGAFRTVRVLHRTMQQNLIQKVKFFSSVCQCNFKLKGTCSKAASWPENGQTFSSAGFNHV